MKQHQHELLDEFHYHEVLDRTAMIMNIIDNYLIQHPVCKIEEKFTNKVEMANMILVDAYQLLGTISYNKFKIDNE